MKTCAPLCLVLSDVTPAGQHHVGVQLTHSLLLLFFISTLSSCMHAVVALLYPFSWQHTFIPVLPGSMLDIVCCPTPFLVGLLSSSLPKLKDLPVEEVSTVVCDFPSFSPSFLCSFTESSFAKCWPCWWIPGCGSVCLCFLCYYLIEASRQLSETKIICN